MNNKSKTNINNPFQPGFGAPPPILAGRDMLKNNFRDRLSGIKNGVCNPTAIVLTGPRGCGKTVLLEWLEGEAEKRKLTVINVARENFSSIGNLLQSLYKQMSWADRAKAIFFKPLKGRVGNPELSAELQADIRYYQTSDHPSGHFFRELLQKISRKKPVILIDEAHNMPPEVGSIFYDAYQTVSQHHPIMLVIAGTPDLKTVLARSHATFTERANFERIGRLPRDESNRALSTPFKNKNRPLQSDVMEKVLDEAQDYPYFLQLWGQALWNVMDMYHTCTDTRLMLAKARELTRQDHLELYSYRLQEMRNNNLLVPIAEMAWRVGPDRQPTRYDFELTVRHLSHDTPEQGGMDQSRAEQKLLHTGFIWEPKFGNWEFGIPSLASYIRKDAVRHLLASLQGDGNVHALKKLADCFGPPTNQPMVISTDKLKIVLDQNHHIADAKLKQFRSMKVLVADAVPDHVRLMAPNLVQAIVAEASKQKLL